MTTQTRQELFLQRIISTVSSSLELDEVLAAVVRLLSDASAVHACFVYLVDADERTLVLKAASEPYTGFIDRIELPRGQGLAWWAAERRQPAFIADGALDDPRTHYVPELEEERFQSLLALPLVGNGGNLVGAITAHTEAPRELTSPEVDFLVTAASLVAGAIENARHYEATRRRLRDLELLSELAETIAGAETFERLLPDAVEATRGMLGASACHLYLTEPGGDELVLCRSSPERAVAPERLGLAEMTLRVRRGRLTVPLVAENELVGLVVAEATDSIELARALAGQLAVGIRKVRLIERLTERNLAADFVDELAAGGAAPDLKARGARLGIELDVPHVVVVAEPVTDAVELRLHSALPGALLDRRGETLRGLVRLPRGGAAAVAAALANALEAKDTTLVGVSNPCRAAASYPGGFEEARFASAGAGLLHAAPAVVGYEELGAYKFLLRIAAEADGRDATVAAVERLARYDDERQTQLLLTLEEFLGRHGSITATSEALYVHPNTLRQRLRRIAELADLDLRRDDWLAIEIAVKLARIRRELARPDTGGA